MKLPQKPKIKWNYTLLAFLLPVVGMFTLMLIRGFAPFGKVSMLYSDMYHQYYPFFVSFRRALLSGDSLLYNWNVGMGMDYLGLISYYLASPLNLLSVLVPDQMLLGYFSLLMPIKLGFASLFFGIFLKKTFQKDDFSIPVFGCFYAFCAWALGYHWNIMWLDTFALLPLVVLGTVALLKERKFVLYTISLLLSVFSNYYIGLFTCIFVALVFFCYEICRWKGIKRFVMDLGWIALYSVLAIGMTAILELPAYAALQTTQSSINKFPQGFQLNITDEDTWLGLLDAMRQVAGQMNGGLTPSFKEGLPNLYCGVAATVFAFLFLTCKQVRLRDKICSVALLLFFNLSVLIRQLDYIWHGFHFTNMIPYRFTFLYSFVLLYMAYQAWVLRNRFRLWQIIAAGVLAVGIALCANDLTDVVYWAYNGVFLLLYIAILIFPHLSKLPKKEDAFREKRAFVKERKYQRNLSGAILLGVMVMEITLNLVNFGVSFTGTIISDYPRGTEYSASMIRYMKERERYNLFYRAETTHSQTLNDGALNDYNGISTFTSSANVSTTRFMKALGYGAKDTYNRYCFEESSPVASLFLNLKYMLERQGRVEENDYFEDLHKYGNVHLLENKAYLPLGFLAEKQLLNVDFATSGNEPLAFQNDLFRAATGVQEDAWSFVAGRNLTITGKSVTVSSYTTNGYCAYSTTPETGGIVVYEYVADREGLMCISLDLYKVKNFSFWKNGIELYDESFSIPQTLAVSQVVPGDVIEVHLICNANEKGTIDLQAGILNDAVFQKGYGTLAASTLELTSFENTRIEGNILCDRSGVLYTSIPQDGNWLAIVDGEPAQTVTIGNAMVGLLLPEGEHTVSFIYRNKYFSLGWKISLVCLGVFVWLVFSIYQPKHKKGKYEK